MEKLRTDFVNEVAAGEMPKTKICAKYSISRVTGDKWLNRFSQGESMANRSNVPFHTPNKTDPETENKIVNVRLKHPAWGPRKIVRYLENAGETGLPSPSTVGAILMRNGLVSKEASLAATPYKRFEREQPNELWQADFKGKFLMQDGLYCHPLTILDDHSRFSLCVDAKPGQRYVTTVESFARVFEEYGKPMSLLCDNGNPWGTSQSTGYTRFEVWLMQHDVLPIHGRPGHPQTQGKEERFHRTLKAEVLKHTVIRDFAHAQKEFDEFRICYNTLRPHNALNLDTPSTRYKPSTKQVTAVSDDWEYPQGYQIRKVKSTGIFTLGNQGYFLSEALGDRTVAIHESSVKGCMNVYFRNFRVGRVNVDERVFVSRKIYRLADGD